MTTTKSKNHLRSQRFYRVSLQAVGLYFCITLLCSANGDNVCDIHDLKVFTQQSIKTLRKFLLELAEQKFLSFSEEKIFLYSDDHHHYHHHQVDAAAQIRAQMPVQVPAQIPACATRALNAQVHAQIPAQIPTQIRVQIREEKTPNNLKQTVETQEILNNILELCPSAKSLQKNENNFAKIEEWLQLGAVPQKDIYPIIARVLKRAKKVPCSLNYFDAEVIASIQSIANFDGAALPGGIASAVQPLNEVNHDIRKHIYQLLKQPN